MGAILIIDEKKVEIKKAFSCRNKQMDVMIFEFGNGSWGYPNGDLIKTLKEVDFIPMEHRERCDVWLKSRKSSNKREKSAEDKLTKMSEDELAALAGLSQLEAEGKSKEDLIELIKK